MTNGSGEGPPRAAGSAPSADSAAARRQAQRGGVRAIVFAYHNVGARCLRVLRAHDVDVPLVVTHRDDPTEAPWFTRVADVADELGLPWLAPADVNAPAVLAQARACAPDFIFSFYCRQMLKAPLLALATRGALNIHGSLLPKYRGRAPVNWAVLHGERCTGATLHYMAEKPDAGDIVAQQRVPILPDDTAREVFDKVTLAAEICLDAVLPALIAGNAPRIVNDIAHGSYFGGRRPEDGEIDWRQSARAIHDLVRAVAPPYPGARTHIAGCRARVLRTRVLDIEAHTRRAAIAVREDANRAHAPILVAECGAGGALAIDALEIDGAAVTAAGFRQRFGDVAVPLG